MMTLEIRIIDCNTEIVEVPFINDENDVTWLDSDAGLTSINKGNSFRMIAAYNHLNEFSAGSSILLIQGRK